jgi:hypothetical protein
MLGLTGAKLGDHHFNSAKGEAVAVDWRRLDQPLGALATELSSKQVKTSTGRRF